MAKREWELYKENTYYIGVPGCKKKFNNNLAKYVGKEEKRQPPMRGCC